MGKLPNIMAPNRFKVLTKRFLSSVMWLIIDYFPWLLKADLEISDIFVSTSEPKPMDAFTVRVRVRNSGWRESKKSDFKAWIQNPQGDKGYGLMDFIQLDPLSSTQEVIAFSTDNARIDEPGEWELVAIVLPRGDDAQLANNIGKRNISVPRR